MSTGRRLTVAVLAQDLLASIVGHFASAGVELPERQAVIPGEPRAIAWDCEQLTVTLGGIGWGPALDVSLPSPSPGTMAGVFSVRHAVYAATLVRCTPNPNRDGTAPPAAVLNAAGMAFMHDAGLISQALVEHITRLRGVLPPEGKVQAGAVEPVGPSGGFHGLETTLAVTAARLE